MTATTKPGPRFAVGDELILATDQGMRGRYTQRGEETATVTRVARTNGYFIEYGRETAFDLKTGYVKDGVGYPRKVFHPGDHAAHIERADLLDAVRNAGATFMGGLERKLSTETLRAILAEAAAAD